MLSTGLLLLYPRKNLNLRPLHGSHRQRKADWLLPPHLNVLLQLGFMLSGQLLVLPLKLCDQELPLELLLVLESHQLVLQLVFLVAWGCLFFFLPRLSVKDHRADRPKKRKRIIVSYRRPAHGRLQTLDTLGPGMGAAGTPGQKQAAAGGGGGPLRAGPWEGWRLKWGAPARAALPGSHPLNKTSDKVV